jgi:hypothetical protein
VQESLAPALALLARARPARARPGSEGRESEAQGQAQPTHRVLAA